MHWAPADKTDITDSDGVVYRYFAGRCFEFHPLADFGALNAHIAAGDAAATETLADALIARGVFQHGGGVGWEYYFDFSGGRAPWLSGMAQAVAAQAFARAATLVPERSTAYLRAAHNAYDLIPRRLLTSVAAGPWIRLYGFQSLAVLNAQLQTVVSLRDYATATEDTAAATLATRMQNAAAATLPRFDTGYWTYYSLAHDPSPLDYQQYVVQLLAKLCTGGRTVRGRPRAHRRICEAASGVHGCQRDCPRIAAPLGLEAVDGPDRLGRGPHAPALACGRLDDRRGEGAERGPACIPFGSRQPTGRGIAPASTRCPSFVSHP